MNFSVEELAEALGEARIDPSASIRVFAEQVYGIMAANQKARMHANYSRDLNLEWEVFKREN